MNVQQIQTLKIGAITWTIDRQTPPINTGSTMLGDEGHLQGLVNYELSTICLRNSLSFQTEVQTIVHEALHALYTATGHMGNHKESEINSVMHLLIDFIRNNPSLINAIQKNVDKAGITAVRSVQTGATMWTIERRLPPIREGDKTTMSWWVNYEQCTFVIRSDFAAQMELETIMYMVLRDMMYLADSEHSATPTFIMPLNHFLIEFIRDNPQLITVIQNSFSDVVTEVATSDNEPPFEQMTPQQQRNVLFDLHDMPKVFDPFLPDNIITNDQLLVHIHKHADKGIDVIIQDGSLKHHWFCYVSEKDRIYHSPAGDEVMWEPLAAMDEIKRFSNAMWEIHKIDAGVPVPAFKLKVPSNAEPQDVCTCSWTCCTVEQLLHYICDNVGETISADHFCARTEKLTHLFRYSLADAEIKHKVGDSEWESFSSDEFRNRFPNTTWFNVKKIVPPASLEQTVEQIVPPAADSDKWIEPRVFSRRFTTSELLERVCNRKDCRIVATPVDADSYERVFWYDIDSGNIMYRRYDKNDTLLASWANTYNVAYHHFKNVDWKILRYEDFTSPDPRVPKSDFVTNSNDGYDGTFSIRRLMDAVKQHSDKHFIVIPVDDNFSVLKHERLFCFDEKTRKYVYQDYHNVTSLKTYAELIGMFPNIRWKVQRTLNVDSTNQKTSETDAETVASQSDGYTVHKNDVNY